MPIFTRIPGLCLLFSILVALIPGQCLGEPGLQEYRKALEQTNFPQEWFTAIHADQGHNILMRQREIRPFHERMPIKILHFDIPFEQGKTDIFKSQFIDAETAKLAQRVDTPEGPRLRFYVPYNDKFIWKSFVDAGFQPKHRYWGLRMQSHSTFFVWDSKDPSASPLYMKFQVEIKDTVYNSGVNAEMAVKHSNAVQMIMNEHGSEFSTFLPESLGAKLMRPFEYAYSVRSLKPNRGPPGSILLPVHGMMGSVLLKKIAEAAGMSPQEWLEKEYAPKLAKFTAETNLEMGLFFASHSQNTLIHIEPKTGRITGFVARDMNDVMVDALPLALSDKKYDMELVAQIASKVNDFYVDAAEAKEPGWHLGIYTSQSVTDMFRDNENRSKMAVAFIESYLKEAEKITGKELRLSRSSLDALESLRQGKDWESPPWFSRYPKGRFGSLRNRMAFILQDVYEKVNEARIPAIEGPHMAYDKAVLNRIFTRKLNDGQVSLLHKRAEAKLTGLFKGLTVDYAYDGKNIIAFDVLSRRPLAYAYGLTEPQKASIEFTSRNPAEGGGVSPSELCEGSWRSLTPPN